MPARSVWDSSHSPAEAWASGSWSLELRDDELADVRFDGRRVLRSIRAVVRDRDWNTAAFAIDGVSAEDSLLEVRVSTTELGADIRGAVRVIALGDTLEVTFDAVSATEFLTNRTGLVVLHPHQLAGSALAVVHANGESEQTVFPAKISPHQPVFDIASLAWRDDGLGVAVQFEGDVFEMEDQRNWSDASFKTYSRPLGLPFPYALSAGERVLQRVTVSVTEQAAPRRSGDPDRITLLPAGPFPAIGVGASTAPDPAPESLEPSGSVLLVELDLRTPTWIAALERAATAGLPLDVRVVLPDGDPTTVLLDLASRLRAAGAIRVAAFDPVLHVTDAAAAAALRQALARADVELPILGGTRSHFTELNRERDRVPDDVDGIVFATTPLFHTVGTEQLVESLAVQRLIARQAVAGAADRDVVVGPVTLRARFNNVATEPELRPTRLDLRDGYGAAFTGAADPRQSAPELAAWTVASAAALAVPGVSALYFFEEWGARGIRSSSGEPLPVAQAVRALAELEGGELLWGDSPDGLVWALGSRKPEGDILLVANVDRRARGIAVEIGEVRTTIEVPALTCVARVLGS
ncbi:hypothetical protein [Microbacterium rhizomatis]|uniref:Uncharacterized protein n=1 Tax=Microbacterium rhizomatis TaxID=1631477 RepID=A0A5J5J3U3_9MICO|nr:hypothetical protein [Microbacterium rhizomatis]KAA9108140.1 hypothetical protein F6B43_12090 [Microbacterium rhizomatis]